MYDNKTTLIFLPCKWNHCLFSSVKLPKFSSRSTSLIINYKQLGNISLILCIYIVSALKILIPYVILKSSYYPSEIFTWCNVYFPKFKKAGFNKCEITPLHKITSPQLSNGNRHQVNTHWSSHAVGNSKIYKLSQLVRVRKARGYLLIKTTYQLIKSWKTLAVLNVNKKLVKRNKCIRVLHIHYWCTTLSHVISPTSWFCVNSKNAVHFSLNPSSSLVTKLPGSGSLCSNSESTKISFWYTIIWTL